MFQVWQYGCIMCMPVLCMYTYHGVHIAVWCICICMHIHNIIYVCKHMGSGSDGHPLPCQELRGYVESVDDTAAAGAIPTPPKPPNKKVKTEAASHATFRACDPLLRGLLPT